MQAPNYDWIASLSEAHKKALEERYPSMWEAYITYGYNVMCYDYSQINNDIYSEIKTAPITETVELPTDKKLALERLIKANKDYGRLSDIVVSVPNYHLTVLTDSFTVMSELQANFKDIPVLQSLQLTDDILHCGCVCVLIDDISYTVPEDTLDVLELNAVPFIRRSLLGWTKPYIEIESINVLQHFISRFKPCRKIR